MPSDTAPFEYVATFIARPEQAASLSEVVDEAADLPGAGRPDWLADGEACDIPLPPAENGLGAIRADLYEMVDGRPVDVVAQPIAGRRKKLIVADMDSTMIGQECIDELADMVGLKPHVAAITERAMRGEIAFEPALRERVALLKGLELAVVEKVLAERITLMPGGPVLIRTMKASGAYAALVSGGFTLFTGPVAAMIGFDENRANRLEVAGGTLAGTVAEPIFGRDAKRTALIALRGQLGLDNADTMAIGDGANDIAMIAEAGLGVAFHAKPKVAELAPARIDHGDLTAMLYIQGYRKDEFVGD